MVGARGRFQAAFLQQEQQPPPSPPLPDGSGVTLWEGELGAGELMFTPSKCAHAVQNLPCAEGICIALTQVSTRGLGTAPLGLW
eukprot:COSAG01_NODE_9758_length_2352_cov_1.598757_3_plen_84_part_00